MVRPCESWTYLQRSQGAIIPCGCRLRTFGFTLIELLVVISIITILVGLLIPSLARARMAAKVTADLSNLRQVALAVTLYNDDEDGYYPKHSSSKTGPWLGFSNRPRWPDYVFPYVQDPDAFISPLLTPRELATNFQKPFAHDPSLGFGGYGYNFQYLGNSRFNPVFHARNMVDIKVPGRTVVVGDTAGSRGGNAANDPGDGGSAVYVLDPPLSSARRAHPDGRAYYPGGSTEEPNGTQKTYLWRAFPPDRGSFWPSFSFADGHAATVAMEQIDDADGDGAKDNGNWNGQGDSSVR